MQSNVQVLERGYKPPPATAANVNDRFYTYFYVVDCMVEFIYAAIKADRMNDFTKKHGGYIPFSFVDFLEMQNHGKFDDMLNPHLVVEQTGREFVVMRILNRTVQ